jgi:hemolysin activation/secretion protein
MTTMPPPHRPSLLAAALLLVCAGAAVAQAVPDAGQLLEQTRPPVRPPLPPQLPPKVIDAPVRPTVNMPEGMSVAVSGFRITGAISFTPEELSALVQPWAGKRLDIAGLNEAAGAITRRYQAAGHLLSYAYLPAQRVADGVIEIAVLEGRLAAVQVVTAQDVRLRDEVIQAHTEGISDKPPVLQADIERRLLLLGDIPGVAARAAFTPGSTTGSADMVVSVAEDEPLAISGEFNNHGTRSTGEYRAGVNLQLRDLFGWGDSLTLRALVSNKGGLVSGSLGGSVPVGGSGWRLGASLSRLSYQLSGPFAALGASGSADTAGVDLGYAVLRSTDTNASLKLGYEYKRLLDETQVVGISHPKRDPVFTLSLAFDRRDGWQGLNAGSLSAQAGTLKLQDPQAAADDAGGLRTQRSWRKLSGQFARQQAIGGPISAYLRLAGQASGGNLDSSEKFALGGPAAVRAYAPGEAQVDQGGLATLELRYAQDYLGGNLLWSLFTEHAEGLVSRLPLIEAGNHPRLNGTGIGLQWSGGMLGVNASLAWRGRRVPTAEGGDAQPRIYLQLVVTP